MEFSEERTVHIVDDGTGASTNPKPEAQTLSLSSLPPITLQIVLPETYAPPSVVSSQVTKSWLTTRRVCQLEAMLVDLWRPEEGVLYTWVEWIRSGEFLRELGLLAADESGDEVLGCDSVTHGCTYPVVT